MNAQKQMLTIETKAKLSALWLVFLLNIVFRDIHEFVEPGFIEEVMTGTLNGNPIEEHMLLLGGVMIEVPIVMVFFSRTLSYSANRWTNIVAACLPCNQRKADKPEGPWRRKLLKKPIAPKRLPIFRPLFNEDGSMKANFPVSWKPYLRRVREK